jgi:hypothetical protein
MATIKIDELRQWVQQYKDDEIISVGQAGAIKAMDYFLEVFGRHGDLVDGGGVLVTKSAQNETRRCIEILNAFMGKMSLLALMSLSDEERQKALFGDDDD